LLSGKPDDNYEDPSDIAAIKEAQENMGDYKLKSADDYIVPDHLRMNVEKARIKILMLKELVSDNIILELLEVSNAFNELPRSYLISSFCFTQVHKHKYDFNQRLLGLRDKKMHVIEEIESIVTQLRQVQQKLGDEDVRPLPTIPKMDKEEMPEK
jgi:hypothetical protein